eukprot:TRINITY_DN6265_c0_g2_i4.p1 TRINITY_DN6265_c0_g2~~TRINITY_DN6265_c0_g2_i4.p1  ORF type:complete len:231 (-),score=24.67 TRINITY_DN6265_c0_g2_i4:11-703(-)
MEGIEEMIEDEEEQGMVENAQIGLNEEQLVFRIQHTVKQHSLNTGRIKRGGKPKIRTEVRRNNPELMNASDSRIDGLVKNKWDECLAKTRGTPMEERQRTTKVMEQKLNKEILKEIEYWANDTIERIKAMREVNIQDLVDTIYNAQVTYQEMTQKREMRSDWRRPLNDKDKSLEETIALMDRRSRNEKLNAREWRKVRDICKAAGKDARTREDLRVVRETLLFGNLDQAN